MRTPSTCFRALATWSAMLSLLAVLLAAGGETARAEPYLAVREGLKCSVCHVNVTGGGLRTPYGVVYARTTLVGEDGSGDGEGFSGALNPFITLGGDFRGALERTQVPNQTPSTGFRVAKTLAYLHVSLVPGQVSLYVDQQLAPGASVARETFGLLQGLPGGFYLKAGKFFLPYGLRLQDDGAFVRSVPQINYNNPDVGLEIGAEPGSWSISVAATNGTRDAPEDNPQKQASLLVTYVQPGWRVGTSFAQNRAADESLRSAANGFLGARIGPLSLLGEVDGVRDETPSGTVRDQLAALAEVNWLLAPGMNLKLTYEHHDPDVDLPENERDRTSLVFEPFLRAYTQLRVGVRINRAIPQNEEANADTAFAELHVFF